MNEIEGPKRRLPPWMMGVAVESESKEVNDIVIDELKFAGSPSRQTKSRARRAKKLENETLVSHNADRDVDDSSLLVKCETKKTRSIVMNREVQNGNNIQEATKKLEVGNSSLLVKYERKRRKRKIGTQEEDICDGEVRQKNKESVPKRRQKMKSSFESSNEEIEDASANEDEGELTMEDLMSIAKEFVSNENNVAEKQPSDEEKHIVQNQFPVVGDSCNAPEITARVTKNKEIDSCYNSAKNSTFGAVEHTRMTGDPAQDMLDLFLGPLLKDKPLQNENKVGLITEHMRYSFESNKQQQKDICGGQPIVPMTKKKTSLRDQVSAFLD